MATQLAMAVARVSNSKHPGRAHANAQPGKRIRVQRPPMHSTVALVAHDGCAAALASGAKAQETVTCYTITKLQNPEDLQYVLQANDLVAETFYNASDNAVVDAISYNSYRVRAAAQTMGLHMAPTQTHATIIALGSTPQQRITEQCAVGVVNVTLLQASESISAAASCKLGTPFAMITNMAVTPAMRGRGISHQLMQAAIRTAILKLDYTPAFALLLAYKYYEPAVRLYESWGFESTAWQDPLWRADAEKGKLGRQRRIMMVKQLSGPGMATNPWKQKENCS